MRSLFRFVLVSLAVTACGGTPEAVVPEPPPMDFTLATSGDLAISALLDEELEPLRAWTGDEEDCTNVRRGVRAWFANELSLNFSISACALLTEGGPSITLPGQLSVQRSGGERFSSAYFDGAANEFADGCEVTIDTVTRWEESNLDQDHLFATGSYTCAPLFSGFGADDTEITVAPGSFTIDWAASRIDYPSF